MEQPNSNEIKQENPDKDVAAVKKGNFADKEFISLLGIKSITGIILYVALVGLLLCAIGLLCPFGSYNYTIFDELKQVVGFFDLPAYSSIGVVLVAVAVILSLGCFLFFPKNNWRKKSKFNLMLTVVSAVILVVAICIVAASCALYEIPGHERDMIDLEAGFYLFVIGCFIFGTATFLFAAGLHNVAVGKITIEQLKLGKKETQAKGTEKAETNTADDLAVKLKTLQKLKDDNIITEAEFQSKKDELLKNFQ